MPAPVDAVRTEALTKFYGRVVGIESLDLVIERGEIFGLLGANGSGKTTTIRLLLDLIKPTSGRALVDGLDCRRDSVAVRRRVGYLPAEMPVYAEMTGGAYLRFLGRLQPSPPGDAVLSALLNRFDISDVDLGRRIRDLSHGMKRKLGIVQALMSCADILVLDEPTAGLDPLMIEAFAETVGELRERGCTVLLSSHVLSEVEKLCDRIGIVARGRLTQVATLRELRQRLPRSVRVVFSDPVTSRPSIDGARVVSTSFREWRLEIVGPTGPLVQALAALPVQDVEIAPVSLESHILHLFTGAPEARC
jgi:ABC-2 type transport system ATP-binding protein